MKVPALALVIILWASMIALATGAQLDPRPLPPVMRTVSDEVGILSVAEGRKLASELEGILDEDGIRVVLVIAETVQPEKIEDYVERLSQRWASQRGIDPTRSIFIVLALNDRELVVMPGRNLGLESALASPEITAGVPPLFREKRFYDGLMMVAARVHRVIHHHGAARVPKR